MALMHNQEPESCPKCLNSTQATLKISQAYKPCVSENQSPLSKRSVIPRRSYTKRMGSKVVTKSPTLRKTNLCSMQEPLKDTIAPKAEPTDQDLKDDKLRRLKLNEERERDLERSKIRRRFNMHKQKASTGSVNYFEAQKLLKGKDISTVNSLKSGITFTQSGEPMVYKAPKELGRHDSVSYKVHSATTVK